MTTRYPQATAKIYQFPVRGRVVRNVEDVYPAMRSEPVRTAPPINCGGAWYHDEACDADRAKPKRPL